MTAAAERYPLLALRMACDSLKVNVNFVINVLEKMTVDDRDSFDGDLIEYVQPSHHCNERILELSRSIQL